MVKKKAILFPYDFSHRHFKEYGHQLESYELVASITPRPGQSIPEVETLLLVDSAVSLREGYIREWIEEHRPYFKEIYDLRIEVEPEEKEALKEYCLGKLAYKEGSQQTFKWDRRDAPSLKVNHVPVIMVQGSGDYCDKFHVEMSLRNLLMDNDFKVLHISSKPYGHLFGGHNYPNLMSMEKSHMSDIIMNLNHYVRELENKNKPDVIVLGVPGGVMPVNESFYGDFGMMNFIVSQAIEPDISIFCTWYEEYNKDYLNALDQHFKYKFGYPYDFIHMSNVQFDYMASKELQKEHYLLYDQKVVQELITKLQDEDFPIFNMCRDEEKEQVYKEIMKLLSGSETLKYCI